MSNFGQFWGTPNAATGPGIKFPGYGTSRYYPPTIAGLSSVSRALTADRLYAMPFFARQTFTFAGLSVYQDNSSPTGAIRLGVYNDSSGLPGTLKTDLGTVSFPASTGIRTVSGSVALVGGTWYWFAGVANAALSVTGFAIATTIEPFLNQSIQDHGLASSAITVLDMVTGYQGYSPIYGAHAYAALPASFPSYAGYSFAAPMIFAAS